MTQKEFSYFFEHACYGLSIARGMKADPLPFLDRGLKNGYITPKGYVEYPEKWTGMKVGKFSGCLLGRVIPVPASTEFVVFEINNGSHFVLANDIKSIKIGDVSGSEVMYDPWLIKPKEVYNVTGARIFYR